MEYVVGKMQLNTTRVVLRGEVNDVYICRDMNAPVETYYVLLLVKKHNVARTLLSHFEKYQDGGELLISTFTYKDSFGMVFPYRKERLLNQFYMGSSYDLPTCEKICINLIMECMMAKLPYPILYLIITQARINMERDFSIFFTYELDLTDFDINKNEKDCAVKCAEVIRELLRPYEADKAVSFILLNRKIEKDSYARFTDLYKDVHLASVPEKKRGIITKIKQWFMRNQDNLFRFFLVICIVGGIIALIMLLSQLISGDIPLFRLLFNPFKEIGTESMLQ